MRKIVYFLNKNIDIVLIFVVSFLLCLPYVINICSEYLSYNTFDLQYFLLADYSLINHLTPYKDLIYPYGLLQYYKESNLLLLFLYYLVAPLNFTFLFYIFKQIIKSKPLLYATFILLYVFVINFTGISIFARYGIFITLSLLFSQVLASREIISRKLFFFIGAILGLIFFLINDQAVYLITSFVLTFFVNDLIRGKSHNVFLSLTYFRTTIIKISYLLLGFLIGISPLIIFLYYHDSITQFLYYFTDLRNIIIVSKTPFFNYIFTKDNIFTILTLYLSIIYVAIKIIHSKNKVNFFTLIQATLIIDILILEQKSIIRSISTQITFVAFILLLVLSCELFQHITMKQLTENTKRMIYICTILGILLIFQFPTNIKNVFSIGDVDRNISLLINDKCYENNLKIFLSKNASYQNVYNYFKSNIFHNKKIFSFPPGDSIFYILFNQIPPYYNSVLSISSVYSQNTDLEYIKNNDIQYIFLNTSSSTIQDGVPDYVRMPLVYRYILNNFYPIYKNDKYLILERTSNKDFFTSEFLSQVPVFKKYLLEVYLYKIPYSEGLYKYSLFKNVKPLIESSDIKEINLKLGKKDFDLSKKIMVLVPSVSLPSTIINYVSFKSATGESTTIFYNSCKINDPCIIDLSNLPFFYKPRLIKQIKTDLNFKGQVLIYDSKNLDVLW